MRAGPIHAYIPFVLDTEGTDMARGKHRRYMELVAYHIYHLEDRTQVIEWRDVTPDMIKKYEEFHKRCVQDYIEKMKTKPKPP